MCERGELIAIVCQLDILSRSSQWIIDSSIGSSVGPNYKLACIPWCYSWCKLSPSENKVLLKTLREGEIQFDTDKESNFT